ncbi:MAG TPA: type II toxin-antitoxin system prevent-host-death family antitoxin [Myxococcales bacterium]|jgi:prevent-host-death family protein
MAKPAAIEIPVSENQGPLSQVISRVASGGERLVISRNGNEQVAVVPVEDLDRLVEFERRQAAEDLAALRASAAAAGTDKLTDEEIEAEIAAVRRERQERNR